MQKFFNQIQPKILLKERTCCIWLISHKFCDGNLSLPKRRTDLCAFPFLGLGDTAAQLCYYQFHQVLARLSAIRIIAETYVYANK